MPKKIVEISKRDNQINIEDGDTRKKAKVDVVAERKKGSGEQLT